MANTTVKVTKRDRYNEILAIVADKPELVAFIEHELELLDKKKASSSSSKRASAITAENKDRVLALIEAGKTTASDIARAMSTDEVLISTQKVTPILRALADEGVVAFEKVKGKMTYTLVG